MKVKTLLKTVEKGVLFKIINSNPKAMISGEEGITGQKYINGSVFFNDRTVKSFNIIENVLVINI